MPRLKSPTSTLWIPILRSVKNLNRQSMTFVTVVQFYKQVARSRQVFVTNRNPGPNYLRTSSTPSPLFVCTMPIYYKQATLGIEWCRLKDPTRHFDSWPRTDYLNLLLYPNLWLVWNDRGSSRFNGRDAVRVVFLSRAMMWHSNETYTMSLSVINCGCTGDGYSPHVTNSSSVN